MDPDITQAFPGNNNTTIRDYSYWSYLSLVANISDFT